MSNSGKYLESFVKQIEKILLPGDINLKTNEKIFDENGVPIAEFDIEIEGKIGTTHLKWLIECRDRPSKGPAPGSWIQQLIGRKEIFEFNKVIAVSTTGFTNGAKKFAKKSGIEIRTVTPSDLEHNKEWLLTETFTLFRKGAVLNGATLIVSDNEPEEVKHAIKDLFAKLDVKSPILLSTETNKYVNTLDAFNSAIHGIDGIYDDLFSDVTSKKVKLRTQYTDDKSHYIIETKFGKVRILEILFSGEISVKKEIYPISNIKNYDSLSASQNIASRASIDFEVNGLSHEISFNKISETGEVHVLLNRKKA